MVGRLSFSSNAVGVATSCSVSWRYCKRDVAGVRCRSAVGARSGSGSGGAGGCSATCRGRPCRRVPGDTGRASRVGSTSREVELCRARVVVTADLRRRNRVNHAWASSRVIVARSSGVSSRLTIGMAATGCIDRSGRGYAAVRRVTARMVRRMSPPRRVGRPLVTRQE
jgi:hypothetical protein